VTERRAFYEPIFRLSPDSLSQILVALGADYTRIQGNNVQANRCFLHHNNSPTLGVSLDSPHPYNCFYPGCSKGTDIIALVSRARGIDRQDAVSWIYENCEEAQTAERSVDFTLTKGEEEERRRFVLSKNTMVAYPLSAQDDIGYRALEYYGNLCTRAQADEYRLGYHLKYHRLLFPIFHSDGELAGIVGRCMLPKAKQRWFNYDEEFFKKGRVLMGSELPLVQGPIIVVEGPSDFIFLRSCGVPNVRALLGAEFSQWQVRALLDYGRDIVPLFDHDKAGLAAKAKFRKIVGAQRRLLTFKYPASAFKDGKADPRMIPRGDVPQLLKSIGTVRFR